METNMMSRTLLGLLGVIAACSAVAESPQLQQPPQAAAAQQAAAAPQVAQVSPAALVEMQAKEDSRLLLLDVRTPEEFAAGHVPGAVNIPYDQLATRLGEIPRGDEVVLYCHSGRRAGLAVEVLAANGYTRLAHLQGDMQGWQSSGRPVESAAAPAK
jgi:phage shock protein E